MRPRETRVLLDALRAGLPGAPDIPDIGDMAARLDEDLDWQEILSTARAHRISALVYEGGRKLGWMGALPPTVSEDLRSSYYSNLARNLVLFGHLEEILAWAAKVDLSLVLLKGAALAGSLYRNLALRPMADLDLLVRRKDARALVDLARTLGYQRWETADHATSLRHPESSTYLEIHTSLTSCPGYLGIRTDDLIDRSERVPDLPEPARTLADSDHALYLTLHTSFQHGLRHAAISACDLFLLAERGALDDPFLAKASTPRLAPLAYAAISTAASLLPHARFTSVLEGLRPRVAWHQRAYVRSIGVSRIVDSSWEREHSSPWLRLLWAPRWRDGLDLVRETLSLPRALQSTDDPTFSAGRAWTIVWRHSGLATFSRKVLGGGRG